jgi:hypothetical protein
LPPASARSSVETDALQIGTVDMNEMARKSARRQAE